MIRGVRDKKTRTLLARLLVGAWTIITPIWFIYELNQSDREGPAFERFKYAQELARNIWIALVVILVAITGIKWKNDVPEEKD